MVAAGDKGSRDPDTERLLNYWATGEGSKKIRWSVAGDFDRCVVLLSKYVPAHMVDGTCANLHKRATGSWPGKGPHSG